MWGAGYWSNDYWTADYWTHAVGRITGGVAAGGIAGQQHLALMIQAQDDSRQQEIVQSIVSKMQQRAVVASWLRKIEADYQRKCLEWAAYSVLLSEV